MVGGDACLFKGTVTESIESVRALILITKVKIAGELIYREFNTTHITLSLVLKGHLRIWSIPII